ncbi:MAG: DEAD/DEAH box helicase [Candidatus Tectimicrobiota bacterium]
MPSQDLGVVIRPDGLWLEWSESDTPTSAATQSIQHELWRRSQTDTEPWLFWLSFTDPAVPLAPSLAFWRDFTVSFAEQLARLPDLEELRAAAEVSLTDATIHQWLARAPLGPGAEYLQAELLRTTWALLHSTFQRLITAYEGTVEAFLHAYRPHLQVAGRIFFHLVEHTRGGAPFAFLATYATRLGGDGAARHLPLKYALEEYRHDRDKLLELLGTVYRAARESRLLPPLLDNGNIFQPLGWDVDDAYTFLQEVPLYERSGILCRIPNWWHVKATGPRVSISIGTTQPTFVGMDALLHCVPSLSVGGVPISADEARQLLQASAGLALIKNKWVAVDKDKLQQTLAAYEQARALLEDGLTLREALALQLAPEKLLRQVPDGVEISITHGAWCEEVTRKLLNPNLVTSVAPPPAFLARLRPYQQAGLNWLSFLDSLGFGACLADDMGLGKTIQVLAFLQLKQDTRITSLLIVPASLLANWRSELSRFAPELTVYLAHPSSLSAAQQRPLSHADLAQYDLVITTYAMVQRYSVLQTFHWDYVILDEAQAIKNPATRQTRAVKKLLARQRLALTGTPVENRLGDLWSLFDFLNPGLLGTPKAFQTFTKTLRENPAGYARLRTVISPYILRRLKTDKSIIDDLPDKVEMKTFATLTKAQIVLYHALVADLQSGLERSDGVQRRGIILSSLLKCKQICNHPDQFLGTGDFAEQHSGKFQRLREICETVQEKREKMLLFTQFRELTGALHDFLAGIFGQPGIVLHGSVPVARRKTLVDAFQSPSGASPFMVLSLKAGGVGLNLTAANHVVHFDRWWNPAVENQATDRAFRIGQQKHVVVHKFITQGTIEEKIDAMLEDKARLSDEVIAAHGESWITELENEQLQALFRLSLS